MDSVAPREVVHRDTVDHIKRVGRLRNRLVTAQHHFRGAAHARRGGVDRQTGHLARQRVDEVGVLHGQNVFRVDLLYVVAQCLLGAFDAQRRHNHLFDFRGRFRQRDVEDGAAAYGNHHRFIAQEVDFQLSLLGGGGYKQRERAVGSRAHTGVGSPDHNRSAYHGHAGRIADFAGYRNRRLGFLFGKENARSLDLPCDVGLGGHLLQRFAQGPVLDLHAHQAAQVDVLRRNEEEFGLLFDFVHRNPHLHVFERECHGCSVLAVSLSGRQRQAQHEQKRNQASDLLNKLVIHNFVVWFN